MIHRDVFLQEWDPDLQFCVCSPILLSSAYGCRRLPCQIESGTRVFFFIFDCEKHTFLNPTKKGWKWRYYEVKTLSSLFLYFKRIMVDCYRAINQGIKFGNIWEICVCPQTLETLEMRFFAKRALLTATKRGGYRRNLLSGPSLLGSSYEGFCQRKIGIELICLVMQRMTVFVCL